VNARKCKSIKMSCFCNLLATTIILIILNVVEQTGNIRMQKQIKT